MFLVRKFLFFLQETNIIIRKRNNDCREIRIFTVEKKQIAIKKISNKFLIYLT